MRFRTVRFLIVVFMLSATAMVTDLVVSGDVFPSKRPEISIKAQKRYVFPSREGIEVTVHIPFDPRNRYGEVAWDEPYPGRGNIHGWQLDDKTQQTQWIVRVSPLRIRGTAHVYGALYFVENDEIKIKTVETTVEVR